MKQSLYLETSVVGAYLDNGEPFRRDLTIRWWERELSEYRAVVSPLVARELERVPEPHRTGYLKLIAPLEQVSVHKIDYLVTWNFGHLANVRRQARIRLFNTAAGFFSPVIVTPEFLVSELTEKRES
jgi:predicted nucleic acid-binding protein